MKPYSKFLQLIKQSETVIVAVHKDPDGDTLGSLIAMGLILETFGLKVTLFSNDGVPNTYKFLPGSDKVISHPPKKEFDIMVAVDASSPSRIGTDKILAKTVVNIDHHPDNSNFGALNYVELLSSVGELIYKIAKEFQIPITQEIAIALYVSIITDTGNFRYSNTLPSTFEVAHDLTLHGASPFTIATLVYDTKSVESLKILAATLENLEYTPDKKVAWASITKSLINEIQARSEDFVGIIDHIRAIKECEVALLFREDKNGMIKVNFRSKGNVNVSKVANILGGGGHVQAAGCEIDLPLNEAIKKVVDLVLKEF
ncbi:bifunctional oligoribonuclease/PAP phosphatase NrnA [Candidatus Saganbacteria bacterium]|nr:bifunctional oligoribonuclease/PAP phosphatase NrnA [Candidatus Saganbacteria bacterium]